MYYDVVKVKTLEGYTLEIEFADSKKGLVDFKKYLSYGGIFDRFIDINYFKQVFVDPELKVLCWPDGLDIAPEVLYSEATGEPLPSWMRSEEVVEQ